MRDALAQFGLLVAAGQHRAPRARQQAPERVTGAPERERIEAARRIWRAARPVTPDDPAGRYLTSRSLPGPWPATLRFLPSARHPTGTTVPVLVAAACRWPDRIPVAVQLTSLTSDGRKAPVNPERWTRGVLSGAAVRLSAWREGKPVHVVEGIEDGLAAMQALPDATAWAALGAGNAPYVVLPAGAEVVLALDGDAAGRQGAKAAASAFAVLVAVIVGAGLWWWQPWLEREEPVSPERMAFPLPDKPSIAVLPFNNMSDDPEQEYFADGMTEDLITDLSKLSGLFVIARNSVFTYKGKAAKVRQAAEELGVRYVLEVAYAAPEIRCGSTPSSSTPPRVATSGRSATTAPWPTCSPCRTS